MYLNSKTKKKKRKSILNKPSIKQFGIFPLQDKSEL